MKNYVENAEASLRNCTNIKKCEKPKYVGPFRSDGYQFVISNDGVHAGCRAFDTMKARNNEKMIANFTNDVEMLRDIGSDSLCSHLQHLGCIVHSTKLKIVSEKMIANFTNDVTNFTFAILNLPKARRLQFSREISDPVALRQSFDKTLKSLQLQHNGKLNR